MEAENIDALKEYLDASQKLDALVKQANKLLGGVNGTLQQAIYRMESITLRHLCEKMGVTTDAVEWFIFECDYGRNPKEAGVVGDVRKIATVDDLVWLLDLHVSS